MSSSRLQERRAQHQRYKEDVQARGKPFYPWAMFHDTVMSLVVVAVIVALACIWYFTSGEDPEACGDEHSCLLGPRYAEKADPGTTSFIPRPDWYFYFLFYLLRIFKWPDSVILATVGIPTILLILLLALPFLDVRRERRLLRRPVAVVATILVVISMGVLTYKGATAEEALGGDVSLIDEWVEGNALPEEARAGAMIFTESGCQSCHTYLGAGSSNLGAPDLTDIGAQQGKNAEYLARYIADPREFGNTVMPQYASLGEENLRNLGVFLAASKGAGG
jgi:menaquinol-cytochrome c reductase cytochrome b/c subunit